MNLTDHPSGHLGGSGVDGSGGGGVAPSRIFIHATLCLLWQFPTVHNPALLPADM